MVFSAVGQKAWKKIPGNLKKNHRGNLQSLEDLRRSCEETLTAGKPIIAIPFFGDQPLNARLMKDYGVAELIGKKIPNGTEGESNPYQESWMTEETVYAAVNKARGREYFESLKGIRKALIVGFVGRMLCG